MKKDFLFRNMKKTAACILSAALVISCLTGCSSDRASASPKKEITAAAKEEVKKTSTASGTGAPYKSETVFVNTEADGTVKSITVSDWLKNNDNFATLEDETNLEKVENVKGKETLTQSGEALTINSEGEDIYYRGSLEATTKLPIDLAVSYKLNGDSITKDELKGADGHLDIHIEYTNTSCVTEKVNGKDKELHVPFLAATVLLLPSDVLTGTQITNGKIIESGDNVLLLGYGFPGMNENFGLSEEDGLFTSTVDISAEVKNYDSSMMMSYYTSEPFAQADIENHMDAETLADSLTSVTGNSEKLLGDLSGLDDLEDMADTLERSVTQLNDGAKAIQTGMGTLDAKLALLSTGLGTADTGSKTLSDTMAVVSGKSKDLSKGAATLDAGVDTLVSSVNSMYNGICKNIKANHSNIKKLSGGITQLKTGIQQLEQLQAAGKITPEQAKQLAGYKVQLETYTAQLNQLGGANTALNALKKQMDQQKMAASLKALAAGSGQIASGSRQLYTGLNTIAGKTNQLALGISELNKGCALLKDGAGTLLDGTQKLTKGTQTLSNAFGGDMTELLDTAKALKKAAKDYQTFTKLTAAGEGKVSFVIKTE